MHGGAYLGGANSRFGDDTERDAQASVRRRTIAVNDEG